MNQRLQQFLAAENISQAQLADNIEVARASVSHVLAGRNKPGYDFIKSLSDHYPKLNLEWLINGKGKMYKQDIAPPGSATAIPAPVKAAPPAPAQDEEADYFSGGLFGPEKDERPAPAQADKSYRAERAGYAARAESQEQPGRQTGQERYESRDRQTGAERPENPRSVSPAAPNNSFTSGIKSLAKDIQITTNQRSITKIIVFFDDNSYQEIM